MDKSTRALHASSDNAAAIDALRAELKRGFGIKMRTVDGSRFGSYVSFDNITSKICAGVIVAFNGDSAELSFDGIKIVEGASPLFAVIPAGVGELTLYGDCSDERAFIMEM